MDCNENISNENRNETKYGPGQIKISVETVHRKESTFPQNEIKTG